MASLREIASLYADELRNGIAWLIVWKNGRSWNAEPVLLNDEDMLESDDLSDVCKILNTDHGAVMLNGHYCGHFAEDMTVEELMAGIRWHYDNGYNLLRDSAALPVNNETEMEVNI